MKPTRQGRVLSLQRTTLRNLSESEMSATGGGATTTGTLPPTMTIDTLRTHLPPCGTTTTTTGTYSHLPPRCVSVPPHCTITPPTSLP